MSRARFRKLWLLGEKPVSGMECVAGCSKSGCDQAFDLEVAVSGSRRADTNHAASHLRRQGLAVCLGSGQNRFDSQTSTGLQYAHGDLAAIGDQDALDAHPDLAFCSHIRRHEKKRLAVLDKRAVLNTDFCDRSADPGRDGVKNLHHLDKTDCGVLRNGVYQPYEGRRSRRRTRVKSSHHRRRDRAGAFATSWAAGYRGTGGGFAVVARTLYFRRRGRWLRVRRRGEGWGITGFAQCKLEVAELELQKIKVGILAQLHDLNNIVLG